MPKVVSDKPKSATKRLITLLDLDELFDRTPNAKIVNNDTLVSDNLSKGFTDAVYSDCDGEIGFVPTCKCGAVRGVSKRGTICPLCGTECSSHFVDQLTHTAWIGIPSHLPPVLHPVWYMILKRWTGGQKKYESVVDILMNPTLEVPDQLVPYLPPERSFRYFYEHFDELLHMMLHSYPVTARKPLAHSVEVFSRHYRKVAFCKHLPILHSSLHPLRRNTGTLYFAEKTSQSIIEAAIDLSAMTYSERATKMTPEVQNARLHGVYTSVIRYYQDLVKTKLGGKNALLRKHNFGTRIHWSIRAVIVPHDELRDLDEVVLPWGSTLNLLKLQILNFLMNRYHRTLEEALSIFMTALSKYDRVVDDIVKQIIYEFPDHKMPIAMGRNPTIAYGSIMKLYVKDFRKDPEDETMSINACIVSRPNADFDGKHVAVVKSWNKAGKVA
jgi:hypothetical protein